MMSGMVRVRGLTGLLGVVVLLGAASAAAAPAPVPGEESAFGAVRRAAKAGKIDSVTAGAFRAEIRRAVHLARVLPRVRAQRIEVALEQVGVFTGRLTKPRALALLGQLRANDDFFAKHGVPAPKTDISDADGIVYRYFPGLCFEFHPLADFSALNVRVSKKDAAGAARLADALIARGVHPRGGGIVWEYYFRFEGGRPGWRSGMAQSVAAQAFARAASLVTDQSAALLRQARGAYRAIPGRLMTKVQAGPWIRLYSFKRIQVLNAQLQSVLSLQSYATATGDTTAGTLASQMEAAAAATVPQFDTGYWTDYSLAGDPSPLSYQKYVVQLLRKLAPADPRFAAAAARFAAYLREPPAFKVATAPVGAVRFWLSKPAWVTVTSGGGASAQLSLDGGWHTLHLGAPGRPGIYGIGVTAVDPAGNKASFQSLPLVRVEGQGRQLRRTRKLTAVGTPAPPTFAVGAGLDTAAQAAQATPLGLTLVRMTVAWQPGETAPDPTLVASLQSLPTNVGLVVDLSAAQLPTDDTGRAELAGYAASLAQQTPLLRDLVLTPAPTRDTAPAYADALAAVHSAVAGVRSDVAVGPAISGTTAKPKLTAVVFAKELKTDGARAGIVEFQPAPEPGTGRWAASNASNLQSVLARAFGTAPPILLDAVPSATIVPSSELGAYTGGAPPSDGAVSPEEQASAYAAAVGAASCTTDVTGLLFDRLVDSATTAEPATGLYYAGGDVKPSASAVRQAILDAGRGIVVCPGFGASVEPTTLTFPQALTTTAPASVVLGCSRDCLYLVTLDRIHGRPVLARRGALRGGGAPQTVTLPRRKLPPGLYRLDVRLVSRVDPGRVTRQTSPWFTVGG